MRTHVMHIEFGNRDKTHVRVTHHASRHNTGSFNHTIRGHAKLLHIRQRTVGRKEHAGNGTNLRHILTDNLAAFTGKNIGRRHIDR